MTKTAEPGNKGAEPASDVDQYMVKDPERFALNLARMIEQAGKAASAWAGPREKGELRDSAAEPLADMDGGGGMGGFAGMGGNPSESDVMEELKMRLRPAPQERLAHMVDINEERTAAILRKWVNAEAAAA